MSFGVVVAAVVPSTSGVGSVDVTGAVVEVVIASLISFLIGAAFVVAAADFELLVSFIKGMFLLSILPIVVDVGFPIFMADGEVEGVDSTFCWQTTPADRRLRLHLRSI